MDKKTIGIEIKRWRKIRGLNQKDMANRIGVAPQNLSFYESGRRHPSFDTLKAICDVLDVDIVFQDKQSPSP